MANVCRGNLDCYVDGYSVTMEDDGNGAFALYISGQNCRMPDPCQAKRVMYFVLHQYLKSLDADAASVYENCCCATGGEGHTYYHGARRLVQPVDGVTPPTDPAEVFVELPYNCDEPLFV